jgi:hypothetical protein
MIYVLKYFSIGVIFKAIKEKMHEINIERARRDPIYAEDYSKDNNQIELLKYINYFVKIFRLVTIILNICYFTGMAWIILCKLEQRYAEADSESFITSFGLKEYSPVNLCILSTYFMFTTLS